MTMRTTARLFIVALLSLGLITGCASTSETDDAALAAEQAIADAKAASAGWPRRRGRRRSGVSACRHARLAFTHG